jgi:hypothetical protein
MRPSPPPKQPRPELRMRPCRQGGVRPSPPRKQPRPKLRTRPLMRGSVRPSPPRKQPRPKLAAPRACLGRVKPAKASLCRPCPDMPSDAALNEFESTAVAAQGLFGPTRTTGSLSPGAMLTLAR